MHVPNFGPQSGAPLRHRGKGAAVDPKAASDTPPASSPVGAPPILPIHTATGYAVVIINGKRWLRLELRTPAGVTFGWYDEQGAVAEMEKLEEALIALRSGLVIAPGVMVRSGAARDVDDVPKATRGGRDY